MTKKSFKEIKKEKPEAKYVGSWGFSFSTDLAELWFFIFRVFFLHYETCSYSLIQEILIRQLWKGKATLAKEKCCVISCHEIPLILPQIISKESTDYQ